MAAGIRWVGPPPAAIRAMGDKAAARRLAREPRRPDVVPGYDGADQSDDALAAAAAADRRPRCSSSRRPAAAARGCARSRTLDELPAALAAARREAAAAFGDDRLILERLVEGPRHVEVQVLFDAHGHGVHLGERDCSIQRRHQKVLEETPSPARRRRDPPPADATPPSRSAERVGYVSAGTCEFLLDDRGDVFFLEMNTRLQVEHPVTEARDRPRPRRRPAPDRRRRAARLRRRRDVRPSGHAIEVRLYAEDAEAGFLPATGRIEALRWPAGDGIRVDAGIDGRRRGADRFDPMLAKIIAHGRDRAEALARLTRGARRDGRARADDEPPVPALARPPAGGHERRGPDRHARADLAARRLGWPNRDPGRRLARRPVACSAAAGGSTAPPTIRLVAETASERTVASARRRGTRSRRGPIGAVVAGDVAHLDLDGRSVAFRVAPPPGRRSRRPSGRGARPRAAARRSSSRRCPGSVVTVHVASGDAVDGRRSDRHPRGDEDGARRRGAGVGPRRGGRRRGRATR